ncbi:type II toxin-antitoxin system VapC family toxin [uncultured Meiothermus sp.]|uniref:type II toxin-antitoxin system VapC family toxin n=1 Tax=uncultured Meiothermus sp. TaxID=157471 RepID=UPI002616FCEF|nr:type II toxin-antitoxin system VapC family toxin [uncultured Meiothermus sp.]
MDILSRIAGRKTYLDVNVFIYALEGFPEVSHALETLFKAIDSAAIQTVTSELALAEALIKPIQNTNIQHQAFYEMAIRSRRGLEVVPVLRTILLEAARLRGTTGLKLPDAIHLATALSSGCEVFLTNDHRIKHAGLKTLLLQDFAR